MLKNKIGIIGYGEIGRSIDQIYKNKGFCPEIKDFNVNGDLTNCDYLHICIPYTDSFVDIITDYVRQYSPKIVIINSTVQVGTSNRIYYITNVPVVHSPIRGIHPNLVDGIMTFKMFIGSTVSSALVKVYELYEYLGLKNIVSCDKSETTELAKLLDTTYYGLCIAFHKDVKELCNKFNLNFDQVMTEYNKSYNQGYTQLGKQNVVRPVLQDMLGPIGGHCVVPNAEILSNIWDSKVLDCILKYKG